MVLDKSGEYFASYAIKKSIRLHIWLVTNYLFCLNAGDVCDDDKDGDGLLNSNDNCEYVVNTGQEHVQLSYDVNGKCECKLRLA